MTPMPSAVRLVDEAAEIVGLAVERHRGEQADAVVAPAEAAREIGDRHHFDDRDSHVRQFRQLACARPPRCPRA